MQPEQLHAVLAGGGNASQSAIVDEAFRSLLPRARFVYLPQAVAPDDWAFEQAYEWIKKPAVFSDVEIEMWRALEGHTLDDLLAFDAVYVMGGNTFHLVDRIRMAGFDRLLLQYLQHGGLIYGISAGAILLGRTIEPALIGPEADVNDVEVQDLRGLDVLGGTIVATHYDSDAKAELTELAKRHRSAVIGVPEDAGVFVDGADYRVVGRSAVALITGSEQQLFEPGQLLPFAAQDSTRSAAVS